MSYEANVILIIKQTKVTVGAMRFVLDTSERTWSSDLYSDSARPDWHQILNTHVSRLLLQEGRMSLASTRLLPVENKSELFM